VLAEAWYTGARPAHLDHCDACAERALDMARWLEQTKQLGAESADAVFTPERLASQQAQIMSRLEQLDRPSKLLSFPRASAAAMHDLQMPAREQHIGAWIAVAAACLVLGVIGGRLTVSQPPAAAQVQSAKALPAPDVTPPSDPFPGEIDQPQLNSLRAIESLTTPQVTVSTVASKVAKAANSGRRR
jgi:hypothetical protein